MELSRLFDEIEHRIDAEGLPPRAVVAVAEAARGAHIRRSRYADLADVEAATASRDLRALTESGLLTAIGEKRGRRYVASDDLVEARQRIRSATRHPIPDPFDQVGGQIGLDL